MLITQLAYKEDKMRKFFILALLVLVGISFLVSPHLKAEEARTQTHKFRAFTANTSVGQSATIFRITGVATGTGSVFGIYNAVTYQGCIVTVCAVEGGEATSGDALPMYDFGPDGISLNTGMSVLVSGCTVVVEYI